MKLAKPFASAAAVALLIVACEPARGPAGPEDPHLALTTFNPLPQPGDNQADEEEFEICKVGTPGDFTYTVVDRKVVPNTSQTKSIHLAAGECQVIAASGSTGNYVTVTENVAPGTQLNDVEITVRTGTPYPGTTFTTRHESGPTINDSIAGTSTASTGRPATVLRGVLAVFKNSVVNAGEIGDFVWDDVNGNGIQDAGEPGIPNQVVTLGGAASATTTTDANGYYLFTGLAAGTYTVSVGTPAGYTAAPSNAGSDDAVDSDGSGVSVTLAAWNSVDHTIDFGFTHVNEGTIGDYVWHDTNGDGIQDAGEPGIAGVTVTLSGSASATTVTDATGHYLFTGLGAGSYSVTVGTPAGYSPSPSNAGSNDAVDSDGSPASTTLSAYNSIDLSLDFGFVPNPAGQIGDFVWNDLNGNGVQDAGEPGISGVTLTLSGAASGTTTTDGAGAYLFTNLPAGSYTVTMTCPAGFSPTGANLGGDDNKDSDASPASVTLPSYNSVNLSIDFGCVENPSGAIGDFVWQDLNANGVQDAGEPGIGGLTVTLTGPVTATTVTNGFGYYVFTGLPAGSYTVSVTGPAGWGTSPSFAGGDPLKDSNGSPASVTLPNNHSTDYSIDFGFTPPPPPNTGQIGDYVWLDENGDGKQTGNEPGISGVTVTLSGPVNATTTTDANGNYLFTGLPAGTYTVTVTDPVGLVPTQVGQGNTAQDNNPNPSIVVLPTNSSVDLTIDFGYIPPQGVGRFTGGGQQIDVGGVARIARGFTLHCDIVLSNNLEINWGQGQGQHTFHITRPMRSAQCLLDPRYRQPPPAAPVNTIIAVVDGTIDGVPGAVARITFIDAGEPGRNDKAEIKIYNAANQLVLNVPLSYLDRGNIQAHYDQPHGSNVNGPTGGGKK